MSRLLRIPSRWVATVASHVHNTTTGTGANVEQSTLISRYVQLPAQGTPETYCPTFRDTDVLGAYSYDLADKANSFFCAIGASNIKTDKKNFDRDNSLPPKPKKKRRKRGPDGTVVVEAYRDRNLGSESEDTETDSDGEGDDDDFVVDDNNDSVIEDTPSNASSIPDMSDVDDDEWVKLKFRHEEEHENAACIDDLDECFRPTRARVEALRYKTDVTRRLGKRRTQSAAVEEQVAENGVDDSVATTWSGVSMEAVMFVPEVPEEMEGSVYHTPHGFKVKQSGA
ncbi:hypothetical protein CONLIGDRAFT_642578 [Coniochaeta ligniaria NRRL 30616]|uniref:Uncharacterized protein n=1 Tax=Coniochaeta ligniaria NRRL 30616 TaxID=1408157 RepID=A0A1J7JRT4_9PEZI|nr:hypothetical protein CONLIGDRAFT_642578 [Coniochaeta ligniaria NRRL 30616]